MDAYTSFAAVYDTFMDNIPYEEWKSYLSVSHDRDFLDGLVSKVYEFGNKQVKEHLSGIYEFLEKKKMDSLRELER